MLFRKVKKCKRIISQEEKRNKIKKADFFLKKPETN